MGDYMVAYGYWGGKTSHLDALLPLIPDHNTYIEVFGGSFSMLLNKTPSRVEVGNDIDHEIINFFRVLRDRGQELVDSIALTPYSRVEHDVTAKQKSDDELESARRFYIAIRQSRINIKHGSWSYSIDASRSGTAATISRWNNAPPKLYRIIERLKMVQWECLPALDLIERYDKTADTFWYCDPPYPKVVRGETMGSYQYDMYKNEEHVALLERMKQVNGMVMISTYKNPLYDELLDGWECREFKEKVMNSSENNRSNRECVYLNYRTDQRLPGF